MNGPDDALDLELAAASLRADQGDVRILLKVLVDQLGGALGDGLVVRRSGGRFRKSDDVEALHVTLAEDQFDAEVDGTSLRCSIAHSSGGIRIRSEKVDMDTWLARLLAGLHTEAAGSQAVRQALERIVIGGGT